MMLAKWQQLMQLLGLPENREAYSQLISRYGEKHRHYHTLEHIKSCLEHLENYKHLAQHAEEIGLAIWFHDAVYKPYSKNNEQHSADLAVKFLSDNACDSDRIARVYDLVMATLHGTPIYAADQSLLVDIDLSVLGCSAQSYTEFEKAVRKEYKYVPYFLYKRGRRKILTSFMAKDRIFSNTPFYEKYEQQARLNMSNAIVKL